MSGNRDCQETSPDRGPPAAVEPRQSIYGMHNAGDGHMPGPTNRIDGQGTDGRGSLYGRSSASRPWDDGNEAEYIPGPSLRSPPGQPGSLPYYDLPRPYPSEPNPSRHIPNYAPSTTLDTRGGASSPTSIEIPTSQYYGESSTSYHQQSSMQVRVAQDRAPPYDYPGPYDAMPPPPPTDPNQMASTSNVHARNAQHAYDPYYHPQHSHQRQHQQPQQHPQHQPHQQQQPLSPTDRYATYPSSYLDLPPPPPPSAYSHPHPMTSPGSNPHHYHPLPFARDPYPNTAQPGPSTSFAYSDPQGSYLARGGPYDGGIAVKERRTSLDSGLTPPKKQATASRLGLDPVAKQERRREQNRMAQRAFRARAKVREQERSGSIDDDGGNELSYSQSQSHDRSGKE